MSVDVTSTLVAPRRPVRTYVMDGRERYADTGREVDEQLGSHVTLRIIDDPETWAAAIEAEAEAELAKWPKRDRPRFEYRRDQMYEAAARVRAEGRHRAIYTHHYGADRAEAHVAGMRPEPGVRYEVAAITEAGACPDCAQPRIFVDGQWWHHLLRYPVECDNPTKPESEPAKERMDGEWVIDTGQGSMICGYCNEKASWGTTVLGYARLTGYHMLGVHRPTGDLVVLAEATTLDGNMTALPHHCDKIPDHLYGEYADEIRAAKDEAP